MALDLDNTRKAKVNKAVLAKRVTVATENVTRFHQTEKKKEEPLETKIEKEELPKVVVKEEVSEKILADKISEKDSLPKSEVHIEQKQPLSKETTLAENYNSCSDEQPLSKVTSLDSNPKDVENILMSKTLYKILVFIKKEVENNNSEWTPVTKAEIYNNTKVSETRISGNIKKLVKMGHLQSKLEKGVEINNKKYAMLNFYK